MEKAAEFRLSKGWVSGGKRAGPAFLWLMLMLLVLWPEARSRDGEVGGRRGRFLEEAEKFPLGYAEFQVPVGKNSSRQTGMCV